MIEVLELVGEATLVVWFFVVNVVAVHALARMVRRG